MRVVLTGTARDKSGAFIKRSTLAYVLERHFGIRVQPLVKHGVDALVFSRDDTTKYHATLDPLYKIPRLTYEEFFEALQLDAAKVWHLYDEYRNKPKSS